MKAQILKHTGLTEQEFYKKYGSPDAFFNSKSGKAFKAKYGSTLKKAQSGSVDRDNDGVPDYLQDYNMQTMNPGNPYGQYFGGAQVPQRNYAQEASQDASKVMQEFGTRYMENSGQGFGKTLSGMFSGGDAGQGGLGKAFGDIGKSFGIGGGGSGATPGIAGGAGGASKGAGAMGGGKGMGNAGGYIEAAINIGKGLGEIKGEKKMKKRAYSDRDVVHVVRKAFDSQDVNRRQDYMDNFSRTRKALMPTVNVDEFFPSYGVGTNPLGQAEHGGEIANTYAPGTLYDDLELYESTYQPVYNPNSIKAYEDGGYITAQNGYNRFQNFMGSEGFNQVATQLGQNNQMTSLGNQFSTSGNIGKFDNAGSKIGSGVLQAVGTYFGGPLGGMIGKYAGKYIGGALDPNARKIAGANYQKQTDLNYMTNSTGLQNVRSSNFGAYTKNGGTVNPQVIKYFGEHDVNDLFKKDPTMNTLRTGGNIRSNEVGDIQALSGGHLEPMSYNPYSDGNGITSMIKGQTHDESNGRHSGVLLKYGKADDGATMGADVEAENNEPITEIGDSAVIFGDIVINDKTVGNDPMFKNLHGKTFKKAMGALAEQNQKLNKQQAKTTKELNNFEALTPIDKLKFNSLTLNSKAIDTKYAVNDTMMKKAAAYQEVVNNEAHRLGINAGDFSRGKLSLDETSIAQNGDSKKIKNTSSMADYPKGQRKGDIFYGKVTQAEFDALKQENPWFDWKNFDPKRKGDVLRFQNEFNKLSEQVGSKARINPDDQLGEQTVSARIESDDPGAVVTTKPRLATPGIVPDKGINPYDSGLNKKRKYDVTPYNKYGWEDIPAFLAPWLRKQPGADLSFDQIAGEMSALSDNDVEPVQARFYHPNLRTPYDISYQDQLNENQADFNQLVRQAGNAPEALAALAGQKYSANSKVLAEQFRANQAMKEGVYNQNVQTLNDALLKNLNIADQQYVRQATAKSNTKAVKQAALNSISDKITKNRLNNRTLQAYANLFPDFTFDRNMKATKTGIPTKWDITQGIYNPDEEEESIIDKDAIIKLQPAGEDTSSKKGQLAKHGGLAKAFRNL